MNKSKNEYNFSPTINLLDRDKNLIKMINHHEACLLVKKEFANLLMVKPITVQLNCDWEEDLFHRKKEKTRYSLSSYHYGNYHVQSPDGHEMFHCGIEKIIWYLNRDLVDIVADNPPTVRFKFNPGGMGHSGDKYYLSDKDNICVVCGTKDSLSRHHVVPRVFRKYLSEEIKSHSHHDIVLLCVPCHEEYERKADALKKIICKEHDLEITEFANQFYNYEKAPAIKSAKALIRYGDLIPDFRKEDLFRTIKNYLGKDDVSDEDLQSLSEEGFYLLPKGFMSYGEYVVAKIENFQEFIERWRIHFLQEMNPKFMPPYWDVNKPSTRD